MRVGGGEAEDGGGGEGVLPKRIAQSPLLLQSRDEQGTGQVQAALA